MDVKNNKYFSIVDNKKDIPIGLKEPEVIIRKRKKKKSKKTRRLPNSANRKAHSNDNNNTSYGSLNFSRGKISGTLRKKIKRFDRFHQAIVNRYIKENGLKERKPINTLRDVNKLCKTCVHCARAINQCMRLDMNLNANAYLNTCSLKENIKTGR